MDGQTNRKSDECTDHLIFLQRCNDVSCNFLLHLGQYCIPIDQWTDRKTKNNASYRYSRIHNSSIGAIPNKKKNQLTIDRWTNDLTDQQTDKPPYRDAWTHLKRGKIEEKMFMKVASKIHWPSSKFKKKKVNGLGIITRCKIFFCGPLI